jgi:hypothetical protein
MSSHILSQVIASNVRDQAVIMSSLFCYNSEYRSLIFAGLKQKEKIK